MILRLIAAYLVAVAVFPPGSYAEDSSSREFRLPQRGALQLDVPRSWKEEIRQPPQDLPPTIVFHPSSGNGFQVLITPIWAVRPGMVMPEREEIRGSVAKAAEDAKAQAVERHIPVVEIRGESGIGYYFSATDRSPKPGEFKYLTQGMVRIDELAAAFTILTNDGADEVVPDALRMLRRARHVYAKAP